MGREGVAAAGVDRAAAQDPGKSMDAAGEKGKRHGMGGENSGMMMMNGRSLAGCV